MRNGGYRSFEMMMPRVQLMLNLNVVFNVFHYFPSWQLQKLKPCRILVNLSTCPAAVYESSENVRNCLNGGCMLSSITCVFLKFSFVLDSV